MEYAGVAEITLVTHIDLSAYAEMMAVGRGLHLSTSQLNLSALHGIGGARRGRVARVKGV